jgi:hypothetical protein
VIFCGFVAAVAASVVRQVFAVSLYRSVTAGAADASGSTNVPGPAGLPGLSR